MVYLPSVFLSVFSILLFPISSLLDGTKQEKKRVVIDFFPNLLATAIHTVVYFYANIVGLCCCGNQKVWRKTAHKVTTMNDLDFKEKSNQSESALDLTENMSVEAIESLQEATAGKKGE